MLEAFDGIGSTEDLIGVDGSFVVWRDVERLRHYANLQNRSEAWIDHWLTTCFGFISQPHVKKNPVHEEVPSNNKRCHVFRPDGYGRAAIYKTPYGYFDVKGIGVAIGNEPVLDPYSTGLINVVDATMEIVREKHVANSLAGKIECVRTLALIVYPFNMFDPHGSAMFVPCALMVREFYFRPLWVTQGLFSGSDICNAVVECELELRKQGLTTCHPIRDIFAISENDVTRIKCRHERIMSKIYTVIEILRTSLLIDLPIHFEVPNIEFAIDMRGRAVGLLMIDFGSLRTREEFETGFITWVVGNEISFSFLRPEDKEFVSISNRRQKHHAFYSDAGIGPIEIFGCQLDKECMTRGYLDIGLTVSKSSDEQSMRNGIVDTIDFWTL